MKGIEDIFLQNILFDYLYCFVTYEGGKCRRIKILPNCRTVGRLRDDSIKIHRKDTY